MKAFDSYAKPNERLLVAILNNRLDYEIARDKRWYRIPIGSQRKWLARTWPPKWIAFYQTKIFGSEKYSVRHFAPVLQIRQAFGYELIPTRGQYTEKGQRRYHQLMLGELQSRPEPVYSARRRRITFIPTTFQKFMEADEINDLHDDSPLENAMWAAMKTFDIPAERQSHVSVDKNNYILDFEIRCANGLIDIETDGDTYHANAQQSIIDNRRNNALTKQGYKVLRFSTLEIRERMEEYCIPTVATAINNLGGIYQGNRLPRKILLQKDETPFQPSLFD